MQFSFDTPFNLLASAPAGDDQALVLLTRNQERRVVLMVMRTGRHTPIVRRVLAAHPLHDEIKTVAQQMIIQCGWNFMRWAFADIVQTLAQAPEHEQPTVRMLQTFRWSDAGEVIEWRFTALEDQSEAQYHTHTLVSGCQINTRLDRTRPIPTQPRALRISQALQMPGVVCPQHGAFDLSRLLGPGQRLVLPSERVATTLLAEQPTALNF